jgi:hypothetical protein
MQTLISRLNGSNGQLLGSIKTPSASGTVSGTVFNGPVSKATVSAYAINNGAAGALIASVSTDGQGTFTMPMGSYSGPVMLQVVGGVYADEATGTTMSMGASDIMSAVMPTMTSGANVSGIWITPITSMAQSRAIGMSGGMTDANIAAANSSVGNYFMVSDILHVQPMNPLVAGSGSGATQDARNCGAALAAMSQYAKDQNMPVSAAMVTAMMNDAYDGMMNGMRGNSPVSMSMGGMMGNRNMAASAGTSGLASAMAEFMSSAANASGLTAADMMVLMSQLNSSGGQLH